jgi:uncharacterized membrane protein YphA (DoxX/SURF4 family)
MDTKKHSNAASAARFLPVAARILLGLIFAIAGLNGFLNFLPPPKGGMPQGAMAFVGAMVKTGYLFHLVAGAEFVGGVLLLADLFVPLALAILAPVVINIVFFHAFLAPSGLGLAFVVTVLEAYLAWTYRRAFAPMLTAHNSEATTSATQGAERNYIRKQEDA